MKKVSDFVIEFIERLGVDHIFYVSGGGAMHLNDSLGRSSIEGVAMIHEQGASIAAESYARVREGFGCCLVTSGPGATNAITGLVGAYIDSIPVIYISGQAKRADLRGESGVRQFGIQEVDIISMVKSYSKYAVQIDEPENIRYELEKAATIAVSGRPGPVWIDIPLDIQASTIEPERIRGYFGSDLTAGEKINLKVLQDNSKFEAKQSDIDETINLFNSAKKPVIILGHGIRLSHSADRVRELVEMLGAPALTSWNGVDLIEDFHPLYFGRPGGVGQRAANIIMQKADFVLTLGTRLNLLATGYNFEGFLKNAKHVMVDIDAAEMNKKSVHPYLKVNCDVASFIDKLILSGDSLRKPRNLDPWIDECRKLTVTYPVEIPEQQARTGFVSNYHLIDEISSLMTGNDIYQFTSSGTTVDIAMKVFKIKKGQRAFLTKGLAAMGYDIPAAVGSCLGSGKKRTVCVTGDGSAAMNMQELEVVKRLELPVKIFVSDNQGYAMIYGSQNGNFSGRLTGCTKESGLTLPDMRKIAEAIGIHGETIENETELSKKVDSILEFNGPVVCKVNTDITQKVLPKQANYMKADGQMASRPIEDMAPLLDRDEYEAVMKE